MFSICLLNIFADKGTHFSLTCISFSYTLDQLVLLWHEEQVFLQWYETFGFFLLNCRNSKQAPKHLSLHVTVVGEVLD